MNQTNVRKDKLLQIIDLQTEVAQQDGDLGSIMELVTQKTQQITNSDGACVELIEKGQLVYSAASGIAEKFLGLRLNMESSLSGECILSRQPLISNDIENDDRVNKVACRQVGLSAMVVVPLVYRDDVVGVIKVLSKRVGHYAKDHIKVLEMMSGLIAAEMFRAMHNERSELFHKATHDSLTGISNRALFYDRLRQRLAKAIKKHESFGIVTLDMDGLKQINDDLGHRAGDAAIKQIALRITQSIPQTHTVSRLGGDEFGIIVPTVLDRQQLRDLIDYIDQAIVQPFTFEGHPVQLKASIGYALFSEDGIELEVLIEKADKAMYAAKRQRKGEASVR